MYPLHERNLNSHIIQSFIAATIVFHRAREEAQTMNSTWMHEIFKYVIIIMVSRHESLEDWQLTEWMKTRKTFRIEKNYSEVYSIAATFRIQIEERKKEETLMN